MRTDANDARVAAIAARCVAATPRAVRMSDGSELCVIDGLTDFSYGDVAFLLAQLAEAKAAARGPITLEEP